MNILGVLQNQWFKDPGRATDMYARRPNIMEKLELTKRFLLSSSSGLVLKQCFGPLAEELTYCNASPQIGGRSKDSFKAEPAHLTAVIDIVRPDLIIAFGAVARDGIKKVWNGPLIIAPHPSAIQRGVRAQLIQAANAARQMIRDAEAV